MAYTIMFFFMVFAAAGVFFYHGYHAGREVEKKALQKRQAHLFQTILSIEAEETQTKERILQEMSRASTPIHPRRCQAR